jgi:hypothetical protein
MIKNRKFVVKHQEIIIYLILEKIFENFCVAHLNKFFKENKSNLFSEIN